LWLCIYHLIINVNVVITVVKVLNVSLEKMNVIPNVSKAKSVSKLFVPDKTLYFEIFMLKKSIKLKFFIYLYKLKLLN